MIVCMFCCLNYINKWVPVCLAGLPLLVNHWSSLNYARQVTVGRRRRSRTGARVAVSRAPAPSCAHNTLLVTGTLSSATCGAATANQHIHDFGGSRDRSPE